ncbi:hypothetical protein PR048_021661 [Dryococelus australis]|uniref:Uncharacterized protein n=1 Tax=Dryococelus australis TaxID=614101 RepID=A0ABQ9GYY0_9NEOP|nr:hypothetical protein PR048_021661 [Dryococelus australis]
MTSHSGCSCTVLGTVLVRIKDANGALVQVHAVLHSNHNSLQKGEFKVPVVGLAHSVVDANRGKVTLLLMPLLRTEPSDIATELPVVQLSYEVQHKYEEFKLADTTFDIPGLVDFLLEQMFTQA